MKLQVIAVRDRAIDAFGNPFTVTHNGQAIRDFSNLINGKEKDSQITLHPEDFDLYNLGEFETDTGKFSGNEPRQIAIGKDLKTQPNGA